MDSVPAQLAQNIGTIPERTVMRVQFVLPFLPFLPVPPVLPFLSFQTVVSIRRPASV